MNNFLSAYMDLIRLSAALIVLYLHGIILPNLHISDGTLFLQSHLEYSGHLAVIVFFVLSGYLVSLNAHKDGNTWTRFALDRLTRLYTVIVPSLILTAIICLFVTKTHPESLQGALAKPDQFLRYILNLLNLQQIWWLAADPGINGPFWSLGYEFWYYVMLGIFVFSKGVVRIACLVLVMGLVGPKIIALLPAWWLGVFAQRTVYAKQAVPDLRLSTVGFLASLAAMLAFLFHPTWLPFWNRQLCSHPWFFSNNAPADTIYAAVVAVNFYFGFGLGNSWRGFHAGLSLPITWLSKRTFSLYLYHVPLMFLIGWTVPHDRHSIIQILLLCTASLALCFTLAQCTELQTGRIRKIMRSTPEIPSKGLA
jgi:peptidoglycan/LPS O-acetylase OafA/YrhL